MRGVEAHDKRISKLRLFSLQPAWVFDLLEKGEAFRALPDIARSEFPADDADRCMLCAYEWLVEEMDKRCAIRRPEGVRYPVWAWHTCYGPSQRKPDLRHSFVRDSAEDGAAVLLTLEVPDDEVLLSDYVGWHYALNLWFLGSDAETNDFEQRCSQKGVATHTGDTLTDPGLHAEMLASWSHIFNLPALDTIPNRNAPEQAQATFWEIRPEFVVEAVWFQKRGRTRRLSLSGFGQGSVISRARLSACRLRGESGQHRPDLDDAATGHHVCESGRGTESKSTRG